jgi:hypothetical protein
MKLSKSRIVLLAMLGLAVAAFLVDRLVSGAAGPTKAAGSSEAAPTKAAGAAAAGPASAAAAPVAKPAETAEPSRTPSTTSVADRLKALASRMPNLKGAAARDALALPSSWVVTVKAPDDPIPPATDPTGRFLQDHRLTAVLIADNGGLAIVNGKPIRAGEEIDGFRLIRLAPGFAVFQFGADGIEVKLPVEAFRGERQTPVEPR